MLAVKLSRWWLVASLIAVLVGVVGPTTPVALAAPTADVPHWAVVNTSNLNMRAGPSTMYALVATLTFNSKVMLLGRAMNTWVQVAVPGGATGWVNRVYLLSFESLTDLPMVWTGEIENPPPDAYKFWASEVHYVQPGETLMSIAAAYNTTWPKLAALNGIPNPNYLYAGQRLVIQSGWPSNNWPADQTQPVADPNTGSAPPPPVAVQYHVVQYGETLGTIAMFYGTNWQTLAAANNLWNPNLIYAGQTLVIR